MTITANDARKQTTATGGEVSIPYDFLITDEDHLVVTRTRSGTDTVLVITTDYTVTGVDNDAGGTAELVVAATAGDVYTCERSVPQERTTDFADGGDFLADTVNDELDRIVQMIQEVSRDVGRSLRLTDTDTNVGADFTLGPVSGRASTYLAFDANGKPVFTAGTENAFIVTAFIETLLDDADAATARGTLGSGTTGDALFLAATAAAARSVLSALQDVMTTRGDLTREGASGPERFTGSAGQIPRWDGTDVAADDLWTYGSVQTLATGSPTEVKFDGIPSWAREVELLILGASFNGSTDDLWIRHGYSTDTDQTTGYENSWSSSIADLTASTTEHRLATLSGAGRAYHGSYRTAYLQADDWVSFWSGARSSSSAHFSGGGSVSMSGVLTYLLLYSSTQTDAFDAGVGVLRYR